jgi:hypothetical protein
MSPGMAVDDDRAGHREVVMAMMPKRRAVRQPGNDERAGRLGDAVPSSLARAAFDAGRVLLLGVFAPELLLDAVRVPARPRDGRVA